MAEAAAEVLGAANVDAAAAPMMGSEDFADMLLAVPGAYAFLGQDGTGPLHSPAYSFDDDIIPLGAALLARIAERRMA
jgi:hippurate hydrolase